MRVIVIGGTGLIGWHAAQELLRRGHMVTLAARRPPRHEALVAGTGFVRLDLLDSPETQLRAALAGQDALVHAAGADPRSVPRGSARNYFWRANVTASVRLMRVAREVGVQRGVMITSYWHALLPDLADRHPYVYSRLVSEREALDTALPDLELVLLQPPYVLGAVPGRQTLGSLLARYVRSPLPLLAPGGGTNFISAPAMAGAVAGALEHGEAGQRYLVGDENLGWDELLARFALLAGRRARVHPLSTQFMRHGLQAVATWLRLIGREPGLALDTLADLITTGLYLDAAPSAMALGYIRGDLDATIEALAAGR